MKWSSGIISGILTGIITLFILFIIWFIINFGNKQEITINDIFPPEEPTYKTELYPDIVVRSEPKEPVIASIKVNESSDSAGNDKIQADIYIIVGSFENLIQAQQKAKELANDRNLNIIVLPPSKEGYYRISCGKYSTLEEAKIANKSIRKNINPDAWILTEGK